MNMPTLKESAAEEAVDAHHRRVAALAAEIGRSLGLTNDELGVLRSAAALDDVPSGLLEPAAQSRLLTDVLGVPIPALPDAIPAEVRAVVVAGDSANTTPEVLRMKEALWLAEALDQTLESPVEPEPEETPLHLMALQCLRKTSLADLERVVPSLPVFPAAALTALRILRRSEPDFMDLERIASSDPTFCGQIINAANSARFGRGQRIRTLGQAITHIGSDAAQKVLLAAAVRPAFVGASLRDKWQHSLDCAELASSIATGTNALNPAEAFIAGLMHDIGALALTLLDPAAQRSCERLTEEGCPPLMAEQIVYGFDHAQAGAVVLETWRFDQELVEAVRHHHAPEKSTRALAASVYIAEFCTAVDEDLPSSLRLKTAAERVGMTVVDVLRLPSSNLNPALVCWEFRIRSGSMM